MAATAPAFAKEWRDEFGNSFEDLVNDLVCGIVNAEPERYEYPKEMYPPLVVKAAVKRIEERRGRQIEAKPLALPVSVPEYQAQLDTKIRAVRV